MPSYYLIDQCALIDPFVSRIPAVQTGNWRIGHHLRKVPTEYGEHLIGNKREPFDHRINLLLKDITLISSGNLTDINRLRAIWRVNTGFHRNIDFSDYTDKNIWIPISLKEEIHYIDSWNNSIRNIIFNGIITFQSKKPTLATSILAFVNPGNEYIVYINDRYVDSISVGQETEASIINLIEPTLVHSIRFEATEADYLQMPFNRIIDLIVQK